MASATEITSAYFDTNGEPFIFPERLRSKSGLLSQITISKKTTSPELVQNDTDQSVLSRLIAMSEKNEFSEINQATSMPPSISFYTQTPFLPPKFI